MLDGGSVRWTLGESLGIEVAAAGLMSLSLVPSRFIDFAIALALGFWCL